MRKLIREMIKESIVLDRPKTDSRYKTRTKTRKKRKIIPQSFTLKIEYFESSPGLYDVVKYSVIDEVKNEVRPATGVSRHLTRIDGSFNPEEVVMLAILNGCENIYDEYLGYKLPAKEWRSVFKESTGI